MLAAVMGFFRRLFSDPPWPEGEPYIVDGRRVGTIIDDGVIVFRPGLRVTFVPAGICSRCQQPIDAVAEQTHGDQRKPAAKSARSPRIAGDDVGAAQSGLDRMIDPLARSEQQKR